MNRSKRESASPIEHRYVSTAQVALALGVSVTTVKRWVDDDVLPAQRTVGGHRKLLLSDVLRLVKTGHLPQADLSQLIGKSIQNPKADVDILSQQMTQAIGSGNTDLIRTLLHGGYQSGLAVETLADRVLAPALAQLGHDWADGQTDVKAEHLVTQTCVAALYELRSTLLTNSDLKRPIAIGGAPEHDHYILPTLLAKLTLLDNGWNAINLGPHTPVSAFQSAIEERSPRMVWLSVTHLQDVESFLVEYRKLHQFCEARKIPIAVGGQALRDEIRSRMLYTTFGDGLTQFAAFARSLKPQAQRPKRGRPTGSKKANPPVDSSDTGGK